jgi:hypothetical protein
LLQPWRKPYLIKREKRDEATSAPWLSGFILFFGICADYITFAELGCGLSAIVGRVGVFFMVKYFS